MSSTSSIDKSSIKEKSTNDDQTTDIQVVDRKGMDTTLSFMEEHGKDADFPTKDETKHLYRKSVWKVFAIVWAINALMFMDKDAMGYSKLLGMWADTNLTQHHYNNVNTLYYAGFLIGQIPGHMLFQISNPRYFMTTVLTGWTILMFTQLAAKNYQGVAAIRFFLGLTESSVTPCLEHTMSKFFTAREQAILNPLFYVGTVGIGIPTGFIAYGVSHYTGNPHPWKIYWIINGGLTTLLTIWVAFRFPVNPARFNVFSVKERVQIIKRIKRENRTSIEEKKIKVYQIWEALKDPVSWLFALFILLLMLTNNIKLQQQVISLSLGVSKINSTLIAVASAGYSSIAFIIGAILLSKWKNSMGYLSILYNIPGILGGLLAVCLPWSNKIGILAGCIVVHTYGFSFIVGLCWSQISAAGYTKRLTRTAMFMIADSVGNMIAPQLWVNGPRYRPAWIIQIVLGWFGSSVMLALIRIILARRNKEKRKHLKFDENGSIVSEEVEYVSKSDTEKGPSKAKVSDFDLTDFENKEFLYPL